jgi:hypothetical protein
MNNVEIVKQSSTLTQLAREIRDHEETIQEALNAIGGACRDTVSEALLCGGKLLDARKLVKHGEWEIWLEANTTDEHGKRILSATSARNYMTLAANPQRAAGAGSIRQALTWIGGESPKESREPFPPEVRICDDAERFVKKCAGCSLSQLPEENRATLKTNIKPFVMEFVRDLYTPEEIWPERVV